MGVKLENLVVAVGKASERSAFVSVTLSGTQKRPRTSLRPGESSGMTRPLNLCAEGREPLVEESVDPHGRSRRNSSTGVAHHFFSATSGPSSYTGGSSRMRAPVESFVLDLSACYRGTYRVLDRCLPARGNFCPAKTVSQAGSAEFKSVFGIWSSTDLAKNH